MVGGVALASGQWYAEVTVTKHACEQVGWSVCARVEDGVCGVDVGAGTHVVTLGDVPDADADTDAATSVAHHVVVGCGVDLDCGMVRPHANTHVHVHTHCTHTLYTRSHTHAYTARAR